MKQFTVLCNGKAYFVASIFVSTKKNPSMLVIKKKTVKQVLCAKFAPQCAKLKKLVFMCIILHECFVVVAGGGMETRLTACCCVDIFEDQQQHFFASVYFLAPGNCILRWKIWSCDNQMSIEIHPTTKSEMLLALVQHNSTTHLLVATFLQVAFASWCSHQKLPITLFTTRWLLSLR
ncbi:hypothetical protein T4C_392 [Trichinella pseudospiralis]|uniref:Uncharacterized protein n=1 Tax=Trichinella pseudospiralis TaxID=6337 RepID=A0A0V1JNM9_TRIPS|nr:hypothetical protein T4C_392 [Trichinella pseudospiralis]